MPELRIVEWQVVIVGYTALLLFVTEDRRTGTVPLMRMNGWRQWQSASDDRRTA